MANTPATTTIKILRGGNEQTLLIPKALGFDTDTVTGERRGDSLIVRPPPSSAAWSSFFADETLVLPDDFSVGDDPIPHDSR